MAPPVDFTPKPLALQSAFTEDLAQAPAKHTEALLSLYALLQEAHERGWLDAARGVIMGTGTAVEEAAKYASTPEGIAMMRNLLSLGRILGSLDPELLHSVSAAVARDTAKASAAWGQKPSVIKIFRSLLTSDTLRGVAFVLGALGVLGAALSRRR